MPSPTSPPFESPSRLRSVPGWIASGAADTLENALFRVGAALAHLHPIVTGQVAGVPLALLRDRMALAAAEAGIARAGGRARAAELRDRLGFLAPDARMDPETAQLAFWRRAGTTGLRGDGLLRLLPDGMAEAIAAPGGAEAGDPVSQAMRVLGRLRETPPDRVAAVLMLADAALARALGWPALLPLLATGIARRDLALEGDALRQACCGALTREAIRAIRLAADLERRAARLRAVAPQLRAKASDAAVDLFLARDAVAPTMDLSPHVRGTRTRMSPRAAARLCDRLVELGVIRELTGRATFRLYGL